MTMLEPTVADLVRDADDDAHLAQRSFDCEVLREIALAWIARGRTAEQQRDKVKSVDGRDFKWYESKVIELKREASALRSRLESQECWLKIELRQAEELASRLRADLLAAYERIAAQSDLLAQRAAKP